MTRFPLTRGRSAPCAAFVAAFLGLALLSACETVEGAGRDLQSAGAAITEEAQDAQTP